MNIKTYSELVQFNSFEERYNYLRLNKNIGEETFGFERIFNQKFYKSTEWKRVRDIVIIRDNGCDLGYHDRLIHGKIIIHHMNPITLNDIIHSSEYLINPEYLITTSILTHNAIHYGKEAITESCFHERKPNDTAPWKIGGKLW